MYNILISGVGAIIGYGIIKSLKKSKYSCNIIGMDIHPDAYGRYLCDQFVQAPYTNSKEYTQFLKNIINDYEIDLFFPGIEQDVQHLAFCKDQYSFLQNKVVLNQIDLVRLSSDKYEMHKKLTSLKSPYAIPSSICLDFNTLKDNYGLPFLMKPRRSYASKGILKIEDKIDFDYCIAKTDKTNLMFQKFIGEKTQEYTVGAFGDGRGKILGSITFQRQLSQEGATAKASVCNVEQINRAVEDLSTLFRPLGPTNFQFRMDEGRVYLLEINPRISSSTSLRTCFGYNEVEKCIGYYLENTFEVSTIATSGHAVRYIEDYVVNE